MRALRDGVSDGLIPLLGPWSVTVTLDDASTIALQATPDEVGHGQLMLDPTDLPRAVSVDIRDPAGNGGTLAIP